MHRGADRAANWLAGALAEIGLVEVTVAPDASEHDRLLAFADAPLHGAHIVASLPVAPPAASDIVRWYREHDDGTGTPDRLRWDGIPADAAALGIANAFLEAVEDPEEPREPEEALFTIAVESGRRFRVELVRTFREFILTAGAEWDAAVRPELGAGGDDALIASLAALIDHRDSQTTGRSERIAALANNLAAHLGLDARYAARLARLLALGRAVEPLPHDDFDPLSRFAREQRTAIADRAAAIAASVPAFADDAPYLAASAAWHEEGPIEPLSAILALVLAADALGPQNGPRRLAAAAGTQFDPEVARAYLATVGAPT